MQKILAFVCVICPVCIARRHWPDSTYAQITGYIERYCPFCRAYKSYK